MSDPTDNAAGTLRRTLLDAAVEGDAGAVRECLGAGASPNGYAAAGEKAPWPLNKGDVTPLLAAARVCSQESVRVLLERGADPNAADSEGRASLPLATRYGTCKTMLEPVRLLLSYGADPNVVPWGSAVPPLHAAIFGTWKDAGNLLTEYFDDPHDDRSVAQMLQEEMWSPLCEVIGLLLDYDGDPDIRDRKGCPALHKAILASLDEADTSTVLELLDRGADPEAVDEVDNRPRHDAAQKGRVDLIDLLVERGASPNRQGQFGQTPLHVAVNHKQTEAIRCLLECGADPDATNNAGRRPVDLGRDKGRDGIVALLESHRARDSVLSALRG